MQIWDYFVLPTRRNYCEENGSKEERLLWKESGLPWKRTDASVCKEQVLLKWGVYLSALEFLENKQIILYSRGRTSFAKERSGCYEEEALLWRRVDTWKKRGSLTNLFHLK